MALFSMALACGTKLNPGGSCPQPTAPVTYTAVIKPFLETNCVSCHSSTATNRQGAPASINLDTYQGVVETQQECDQDILSGRMPPNSTLSQDARCTFDAWLVGGSME